ncbi:MULTISPECIES: helix-turn-helix transcriptional regulator [Streptomyces]|uniref:WYL domain-containing transcriptional regulator n=2 Tax=Streptomyces TaxID=1883 RepID=A0A3R7J9I5_9ACTN|nr:MULTISPECIES: WYL domain-containing protein [Streptomyces]KNE82286.1 transcriptional regulator [Streptomyces fradiae]OFA55862.1 transcriptional regulator [Streptomyces fradiae]PQM25057.1 WYL domain-containing transcriptional regulator [Streptomyces xinghaiensis]RKM99107.1 WYL domain-containing transcriptional regulator [Streptomyces xinghaiensis]RNC75989.1 WYL domain-containing transcriptional regulator [Streptomyces xinghaiensis]
MRAARLIRMVLLLQSRPSMTGAELARELEVSERTVARDVLALSEAGVPVYAARGRTGGYRLIGGYRTRLTGLARGEAETLFLSGVPSALRAMGLADTASAARLKVAAALLPELSDTPASAAQRFHLDAPGWWQEPVTPEPLPLIAEAVWGDRLLTARYRRRAETGGTEVRRTLEPYGLVLKAGVWYLVARPAEEGLSPPRAAVPAPRGSGGAGGAGRTPGGKPGAGPGPRSHRVYRVERFDSVSVSEQRFARDEGFDLPGFWRERAAEFARSILRDTVVVRLSAAGARKLPRVTDRVAAREALAAAGEADGEGWVTVTLPVESLDVAHEQVLALGPEAELLEPPVLRARFAEAAARAAALYARDRHDERDRREGQDAHDGQDGR